MVVRNWLFTTVDIANYFQLILQEKTVFDHQKTILSQT